MGVPKLYFNTILEYIYSDHFFIHKHSIEFFVRLLIFADYFMLPRLVEICSRYLMSFLTQNTALSLLLLAHSHNAEQLENYCVHFIAMHESEIYLTAYFKQFKQRAHPSLFKAIMDKIRNEVENCFLQIAVSQFKHRDNLSSASRMLGSGSISSRGSQTQRRPDMYMSSPYYNEGGENVGGEENGDDPLQIDELIDPTSYIYF